MRLNPAVASSIRKMSNPSPLILVMKICCGELSAPDSRNVARRSSIICAMRLLNYSRGLRKLVAQTACLKVQASCHNDAPKLSRSKNGEELRASSKPLETVSGVSSVSEGMSSYN